MKKVIILLEMLSVSASICAQGFDEWFRQNKTELDYLRQQIAALQASAKVTEDGYRIVQQGTGLITGIKQEDYSLHEVYFKSLVSVRSAIGEYPVIQSAIDLENRLESLEEETINQANVLAAWSATVAAFFQEMLADCRDDFELLKELTTDGEMQLTDAERLAAIDRLYSRMQERYRESVIVRETVLFLRNNLTL